MTTNSAEYARRYYLAHREQIKQYQRDYHQRKKKSKTDIVTGNQAFNLSFQSSLKNIEQSYNDLLKKHTDLLEAYNNMKQASKERSNELTELREWKNKIKDFFNL